MNRKDTPTNDNGELAAFRRVIDDIDNKIIQLLIDRTQVVSKVGELKRRTAPGQCPIRPAREATMVRDIIARFKDSMFMPAAAAAIWRIIIGTSTSVEALIHLSVYTPDRENDLYWLAREYFGPGSPVIRQPHVKRVIGDVMEGKAFVGVVPMLRSADTTYWWTNLMEQGPNTPKIFARIPFVNTDTPSKDAPSGLALARIAPEASGDDVSLLVLEADHNVSQSRMQTAFATAKLEANWINVATLAPNTRHHLIEVKGFITSADEPSMRVLLNTLGSSIFKVTYLGAYAVPMTLGKTDTKPDTKAKEHAAVSAQS